MVNNRVTHIRSVMHEFATKAFVVVLVLGISWQKTEAQNNLGLHFTPEEITIWKDRAKSGPYRKFEDVSKNSPEGFARVIRNKDKFVNRDIGSFIWKGWQPESTDCIPRGSGAPSIDGPAFVRDAAFYALIKNDHQVKLRVKKYLLAQAGESGVDFSNDKRWCLSSGSLGDIAPGFLIANWTTKLLFAYDYVKDVFNDREKSKMNSWFYEAAEYFITIGTDLSYAFRNWKDGDYTLMKASLDVKNVKPKYFKDPHPARIPNSIFNNRRGCCVRFATLVGIMLEVDAFKSIGKRWVKDVLKYQMYQDGSVAEFHRGNLERPNQGWIYGSYIINQMVTISDAFARIGDMSLYDYKTTEGIFDSEAKNGPPKSLKLGITALGKYLDGTFDRYVTDSKDPFFKIDGVGGTRSQGDKVLGHDFGALISNLHYRDPYIKALYMRSGEDMPGYGKFLYGAGDRNAGQGDFGIFPDVFFMYAQLEGKIDPYRSGNNR